jgi:hypothetical protein
MSAISANRVSQWHLSSYPVVTGSDDRGPGGGVHACPRRTGKLSVPRLFIDSIIFSICVIETPSRPECQALIEEYHLENLWSKDRQGLDLHRTARSSREKSFQTYRQLSLRIKEERACQLSV